MQEEEGYPVAFKGRVPNMTNTKGCLKVDEECRSLDSGFIECQFNMEEDLKAKGSLKPSSEPMIKICKPLFGLVKHHVSSRLEY